MFKRSVPTLTRGVVDTIASMRVKNLAIYTELQRQATAKAAWEAATLDVESIPVVEDLALQIAKAAGDAAALGSKRALIAIRPGDKLAIARLQYRHWQEMKTILEKAEYHIAQTSIEDVHRARGGLIPMFRVYAYGYERITEPTDVAEHIKKEKYHEHWRTYEVSL